MDMEKIETILKIVSIVASFLFATLIPFIIAAIKKGKAYKQAQEEIAAAKTEEDRKAAELKAETAKNELLDMTNSLIQEAENTYKNVDKILKTQTGTGSGAVKKESVMTKLQAACLERGVEFDADYWSAKIDELISLTKAVNAKGA